MQRRSGEAAQIEQELTEENSIANKDPPSRFQEDALRESAGL
jgi:hypothetical protein